MKKLFSTTWAALLALVPSLTRADNLRFDNPLGALNGPGDLYGRVIGNFLVPMLGTASLIMFVYAGFMMVTSQGNEEKAKKGQQTMFWAAVGVGVAFTAYIVLNFFISGLTESTTSPS